jgi:hypothetical protein
MILNAYRVMSDVCVYKAGSVSAKCGRYVILELSLILQAYQRVI